MQPCGLFFPDPLKFVVFFSNAIKKSNVINWFLWLTWRFFSNKYFYRRCSCVENAHIGWQKSNFNQITDRGHMPHQLSIQYPQNWLDALQLTQKSFEEEAKMAMASKLFEMRRLSSGMAAKLVGVPRVIFLLNLHRFNVPMVDMDEDELSQDIKNA
jgi:predicted HTH domain antitoxin